MKEDIVIAEPKKSHVDLIKLAYVSFLAGNRSAHAKTKKRGEVRGGGRKPWRQKGTGRARQGSIRSPQWVGGGVVWGPTGKENYSLHLNSKEKQAALLAALYLKNRDGKIKVVEIPEIKKTKEAANFFRKPEVGRNLLLITTDKNEPLKTVVRNIPGITVDTIKSLNIFEIVNSDTIMIDRKALGSFQEMTGAVK